MSNPLRNSQEVTVEQKPPEFNIPQKKAANELTSNNCLCELPTDSNVQARLLANNPSTPPEELRQLAVSSDAITRSHVAANPNTPTEVLLSLCGEFPKQVLNNPILTLLFLENPNLFDAIPINKLITLLKQDNAPVFLLEWAANQLKQEVQVQFAIAMNAQTPRQVLEKFVDSQWSHVAEAARLHVNLAGEMQEGWDEAARDVIQAIDIVHNDWLYLEKLAKNGLIPELAIEPLLRNSLNNELYGLKILKAAAESVHTAPSALEQLARYNDWEIRSAVACNLSTPANVRRQLASDRDWLVREAVAYNPTTPRSILAELASDRDWLVRKAVLCNPNTPVKLLEQLVQDRDNHACGWITQKFNTSLQLLEHLVLNRYSSIRPPITQNPTTLVNLLLEVIQQSHAQDSFIPTPCLSRFIVLLHPQTPEEVLVSNCRSYVWLERYAIAQNPNTPLYIVKGLVKDANRIVRAAAKANLESSHPQR